MRGKKKGRSAIVSAMIGSVVAVAMVLLLVVLISNIILNERVGEEVGYRLLFALHIIAVFVGAETAKKISAASGVRIAGIVICIYGVLITVTGLLSEGKFENIWLHLLSICAGFLLSCALCIRKTGRNVKKKNIVW